MTTNIHDVLGETPTQTSKSKYNTFCDLCNKRIFKGETVRLAVGQVAFILHLDCNDYEVKRRMHKVRWTQDIKKRKTKRTK